MQYDILFLTNNNNAMRLAHWLQNQNENVVIYAEKLTKQFLLENYFKIVISYNYKYIITKSILEHLNYNVINLHISLLPWNRGANPNYWSFIDNTPKGVTIHKMDEGIDTGNIIFQKELFFDEKEESFASSYEKLHEEIFNLFISNWDSIKQMSYKEISQGCGGSYHSIKDFTDSIAGLNFTWNDNIYDYKKRAKLL